MSHLLLWISFIYDTSHAHYKKMLVIRSVLKLCYPYTNLFTRTLENWHLTIAKSLIQIQHTLASIQDFLVITLTHSLLISRSQIAVGGLHPNFMGVGKPKKMTKGHSSVWLQWTRNDDLATRKTSCAHTFISTAWGMSKRGSAFLV